MLSFLSKYISIMIKSKHDSLLIKYNVNISRKKIIEANEYFY